MHLLRSHSSIQAQRVLSIRHATAADGNRTMRWRTALRYGEAVLHASCLYACWMKPADNTAMLFPLRTLMSPVFNVDQADCSLAAIAAAAAVATSGGYEVELLIGQFDRVSKIGNVLHVGLLLM